MSIPSSQSEDSTMQTIKCTVVGDLDANVAELLSCFTSSTYAAESMPTVFRDYTMTLMIKGKPYTLGMFDATGQMNEGQRVLSYSHTDVFLVCFSVVSPSSFVNAQRKWVPEVVKHCPKRPFVLVGTQIDLRSDEATVAELMRCNQEPVSQITAEHVANEIKAMKYIECSGWTPEGLAEVFDEFILQSLTPPKSPSKWSSFLHPKVAFPILRSRSKIKSSHSVTEDLDTLADKHNTIKCVVVADSAVRTTALLVSYTSNTYHTEYEPTVFDTYSVTVMVNKEPYTLGLIDVSDAGHRQYMERIHCYSKADVFLVCFSVVSPSSFENIRHKWVPEIAQYCPGVPFIIVGTDTHLREDALALNQLSRQGLNPVAINAGVSLARDLNAAKYMECSVKTYQGLKNVFDEAVLVALTYDRPRKRKTFFEHFRKRSPKKKPEARIQSDGGESERDQLVQSPILKPLIRVTPEPTQAGDEIRSKGSQDVVDGSEASHPGILRQTQEVIGAENDHSLHAGSLSPVDMQLLSPVQTENEAPTLMELVAFPTNEGVVNIPAQINTKYKEFGDLLLGSDIWSQGEDMGSETQDPVEINTKILRKWLRGGGRSPVSWATLADVLECIDMARLAYQIRYMKMPTPFNDGASALSPADQAINYRHSLACSIQ